MRPIVCVIDTGAGPSLVEKDVLDCKWLDSIRHSEMPEIRSASDRKLVRSGTITLHLRLAESHTRMIFGVVDRLAVSELLDTTSADKIVKSIQQAERKIFSYHTRPMRILMVQNARSETEKSTSEIPQFFEQDWYCWWHPTGAIQRESRLPDR